ncbi:ADP-ribosylation factor-binding protein GGA3-like [Tropilaelaps mercedesae]|uniref:ADP-ribosylation factor-binding protein GGA3-like n=1 Tax=Tropilaelaps mercedesae TaxID=418985 RepID=A0A1V9XPS3_9ACAR|nr:ADP-ribosylation factor-binding protein GGA3-like [Tropilaelaps mercedesae]
MANPEGLDLALAQATNPLDREMNLEAVQKLCQLILLSRDAPQEVLRIIAHKVQSPQEREALRALEVLEECVSRCGGKLNNEVGKFRFLNELIRVVSPKYLGQRAPESVKRRVVEILFKWSVILSHETKIVDAYAMLKRQGVVEEDPIHVLPREEETEQIEAPPPREDEIFTDKQKELELKRLLGSKNPEDLQAANRLIKTMVKEADRKIDLKGRKLLDLEEAASNCALFSSLLRNFRPDMKPDELELLQQMFENCDKLRPKLFTLASEFSLIEDFSSVQEVLQQNDELTAIINEYKERVLPMVKNRSRAPVAVTQANAMTTDTRTSTPVTLGKQTIVPGVAPSFKTSTTSARVLAHAEEEASGSTSNGDEHLNFDPLSSKSHHSSHADDVSLLDSQMSSLTVSPTTDALITIESSVGVKHDDLLNLMDLSLSSEPSSACSGVGTTTVTVATARIPAKASASPATSPSSEPLRPIQVPGRGRPSTPAVTVTSAGGSGQLKSYAPFEGLDTLMSKRILAKRVESAPSTNLTDLEEIALADIIPSTQPPLVLSCQDDVTTILHVTENRPAEDVLVILVTTTNRNARAAVKNFSCLLTSQGSQTRPLAPSGNQLPVFNSFVPSTAITQIILLEKLPTGVRIAFTLTYTLVSAGGIRPTPVTISGEKQL